MSGRSANWKPRGEWFIYALIDPRTADIRYVGFAVNPAVRLKEAPSRSTPEKTPKPQRQLD